jgi:hypothetical protein
MTLQPSTCLCAFVLLFSSHPPTKMSSHKLVSTLQPPCALQVPFPAILLPAWAVLPAYLPLLTQAFTKPTSLTARAGLPFIFPPSAAPWSVQNCWL